MVQKSIGGGRTRSPLKSVQLARESLAQAAQTSSARESLAQKSSAQAAQTSSNQINLGQQRWANIETRKPSSDASQRLTSVKDRDVSLIVDSRHVEGSLLDSSPLGSSPSGSSILGSSSRLLESSASVAIVPSKKQPTSGEDLQGSIRQRAYQEIII